MRQFIDVTGKTEEEAINRALEQLKLDRDDVSVEILERAKAGFLGLGSCPAKVRVSYGEDEEPAAPAQPKAEKVREDKPKAEKPRAEKKPAEKPQRREEPVKKESAPKTEEAQTVKSPEDLGEEAGAPMTPRASLSPPATLWPAATASPLRWRASPLMLPLLTRAWML